MDIGGTYAGRGATVAVSADVFLVWVALAAASFLPPKGAAAQVGASCAAFAAVLVAIGGPAAPAEALYVTCTACVTAAITAFSRAELTALAKTDFLTGLPNRQELYLCLSRDLDRAARAASPFSVAILDLDDFKEINDGLGHLAGDRALVDVTQALALLGPALGPARTTRRRRVRARDAGHHLGAGRRRPPPAPVS